MSDSYVCSGAMLKCTMGTSQSRLKVLPKSLSLTRMPQADINDYKAINIAPFGLCRSLSFPQTATATTAAHGALTPMPCIPNVISPWSGGKEDCLISGQPALLKSSRCNCVWGGRISITSDGQKDIDRVFHKTDVSECQISLIECLIQGKDKVRLFGLGDDSTDKVFYYLTDNRGEEVDIQCHRIPGCSIKDHLDHVQHDLIFTDINTGEKVQKKRYNIDGRTKLYYRELINYKPTTDFNLGAIGNELAMAATIPSPYRSFVDYSRLLHYFFLPINDAEEAIPVSLQYHCCTSIRMPSIIINCYPNIEFAIKLGGGNESKWSTTTPNTIQAESTKTNVSVHQAEFTGKNTIKISFSVKYASETKSLELKEVFSGKEAEGNKLYQSLMALSEYYEHVAKLVPEEDNSAKLQYESQLFNPNKEWLSGSVECKPSIEMKWGYSTSDDLRKLGTFLMFECSLSTTGKLTIDLIKLAISGMVGLLTGPLAGIIEKINEGVIIPLLNKFVDLSCNLIVSASPKGILKINIDTAKELYSVSPSIGLAVKCELELKLTVKTTLFIKMEIDLKGKAEAGIEGSLSCKDETRFIDNGRSCKLILEGEAFFGKVTVTYTSQDSYEISSSGSIDDKRESEIEVLRWDGFEKTFEPKEFVLFD